jgi:hypothetical protein
MTNEIEYKGFIIEAHPQQLVDTGWWTTYGQIYRHSGSRTFSTDFYASPTYKTREEAIIGCLEFGKRIIDGEFPDLIKKLP